MPASPLITTGAIEQTDSQRSMVGARLANLPPHRPGQDKSANLQTSQVSQPQAAAMLDVSPRGMVAAKLANRPKGGQPLNASIEAFSQDEAAAAQGVSRSAVQRAVIVLNCGDAELIDAVAGEIPQWTSHPDLTLAAAVRRFWPR